MELKKNHMNIQIEDQTNDNIECMVNRWDNQKPQISLNHVFVTGESPPFNNDVTPVWSRQTPSLSPRQRNSKGKSNKSPEPSEPHLDFIPSITLFETENVDTVMIERDSLPSMDNIYENDLGHISEVRDSLADTEDDYISDMINEYKDQDMSFKLHKPTPVIKPNPDPIEESPAKPHIYKPDSKDFGIWMKTKDKISERMKNKESDKILF